MKSSDSSFKALTQPSSMETPTSEPSSANEQMGTKGAVGIMNIGNTCYLNSTLQALRNSTELTAFFLEQKHEEFLHEKNPEKASVRMTRAYIDVLRHLWGSSRPHVLHPHGFFQEMCKVVEGTHFDQFRMRIAHDSHEFLMFMLNSLHEALAEEVNIVITRPPPVTENDKLIHQALEFWRSSFTKSYSPLVDVLFGLYQREMACHRCKKSTYSWEVFNCLKVGFPEQQPETPPTLDTLLKDEFKDETIEGYACDHCSPERTTATRKTHLWKLPRTLFVVLKRFSMTGQKLQGHFDLNPDMPMSFESYFSASSPEPSRAKNYSLFATVDHFGVSGGGHYTAQALSPLDQKWYGYDDDSVVDLQKPSIGRSTYILCFKAN